jgi:hypothetical protein
MKKDKYPEFSKRYLVSLEEVLFTFRENEQGQIITTMAEVDAFIDSLAKRIHDHKRENFEAGVASVSPSAVSSGAL